MANNQERIRTDRMAKLLANLHTEVRARHDQGTWIKGDHSHSCGTAACIAGHTLILNGYAESFLNELGHGEKPRIYAVEKKAYTWLVENPSYPLAKREMYKQFNNILFLEEEADAIRHLYEWVDRHTDVRQLNEILDLRDMYIDRLRGLGQLEPESTK